MTDKYTVRDLLYHAADQRPSDFEAVFNGLAIDRVERAVAQRKQEMAKYIFNDKQENEVDDQAA
jgi:hypothetical protein